MTEERQGKQVNKEGFYGKITQEMLSNELDNALKQLKENFEKKENCRKILILSLEEIKNTYITPQVNSKEKFKPKDANLEKQNEELFHELRSLTGIDPTQITELRDLATKLTEQMGIPFPKILQKKHIILDWFRDNREQIRALILSNPTIFAN